MNLRAAGPGWLFCPADRPERFAKAAAAADVVILDLEDGVAEADKPAARKALQDTPLTGAHRGARQRVQHGRTGADLDALAGTASRRDCVQDRIGPRSGCARTRDVIALIECSAPRCSSAESPRGADRRPVLGRRRTLVATLAQF